MTHLEKLTLYLRILTLDPFADGTSPFIDGTHLDSAILVHMPLLHAFIFYISTETIISSDSVDRKSSDDIQKTFTNINYGRTACIIDNFNAWKSICHVYSLPFTFTRLEKITNNFPNILFDTVTHLYVYDMISMKHEFFMRISRAFPVLKCFTVQNETFQSWNGDEFIPDNPFNSVIEYSHLISLDLLYANTYYVMQFLLETKTHLPRLTELKVNYNGLVAVTKNFTRDATRRNCSKVKRLYVFDKPPSFSKDFYRYFPSL